MIRITDQIITDKGLDYIRSLPEFEYRGNHYFLYPKELDRLEHYTKKTEYYGPSDQGSSITVFKRMTEEQIAKLKFDQSLQLQIEAIEKKFNVKLKIV